MSDELHDVNVTAAALKISKYTLYRKAAAGDVPCYRIGPRGRIRFDLDEVRAALRSA